jgi:hypothetical protein
MFAKIFALACIFFIGFAAHAEPLEQQDYEGIRNLSNHVLERLPAESHYFLGIGRGPVGVVAFWDLVHPDSVSNFPFSAPGSFEIERFDPAQHAVELKPFFEQYLPSDERLKGRALVVPDDTLSGGTLLFFLEATKHYYASQGKKCPDLVALPLTIMKGPIEFEKEIRATGATLLRVDTNQFPPVAAHLTSGIYKGWSEYENPGFAKEKSEALVPLERYRQLRRKMAPFVLNDSTLPKPLHDRCRLRLGSLSN